MKLTRFVAPFANASKKHTLANGKQIGKVWAGSRAFSTMAEVSPAGPQAIHIEDGSIHNRPRNVYVNRPRPQWNALKCTQCLECVTACDQSALFPAWLPREKVKMPQFKI